MLTSQLAWQPNRDRDLVLVHIDPRHTGMKAIHPASLAHPPGNGYGHAARGARYKIKVLSDALAAATRGSNRAGSSVSL